MPKKKTAYKKAALKEISQRKLESIELQKKIARARRKLKREQNQLKKEVLTKFTVLITSAFGLVAALAWNDTIKALFAKSFGQAQTFWAMSIYAATVTIIAVCVTYFLSKMSNRLNQEK